MGYSSILIIEDHKDFREALKNFLVLNRVKANVMEASSGEEGVDLARRFKPYIVLTDFSLGGINGLEAARLIKKNSGSSNIILLSMYDLKEISGKDKDKSIRCFVSKDHLHDQLMPAIRGILRNPESSSRN